MFLHNLCCLGCNSLRNQHWNWCLFCLFLLVLNRTYYFYYDIINIEEFDFNLLKIDKKSYKDIEIYYTGYITIKKIGDFENIYSVNPLHLITS